MAKASSRRWWPFGRRQAPAPTPVSQPVTTRDPMTPRPPLTPFSAFWVTGRVPQRANIFLDTMAQAVALGKERSFQVLGLSEGSTVLDVGCGTGRDVARLMELVGTRGEVWGVDNSAELIKQAKADNSGGLFVEGDVYKLPFQDAFFDAVRAERVLMHLGEPHRALEEMMRVTKPGGIISIIDPDIDDLKVHPLDPVLFQRFISFTGSRIIKHPRIELEMYDHLLSRGLSPAIEMAAGTALNAPQIRQEIEQNFATSLYSFVNPVARLHAVQAGVLSEAESEVMGQIIQQSIDDGRFLMTAHQLILYCLMPDAESPTRS